MISSGLRYDVNSHTKVDFGWTHLLAQSAGINNDGVIDADGTPITVNTQGKVSTHADIIGAQLTVAF